MFSILNFKGRRVPAFLSLGGMILSIGLTAGAAQASQKSDFLSTVDESISGTQIAQNGYRYVGKHVDIHCTVGNIPTRDFFNADCGSDPYSINLVVINHSTSDLTPGQALRVIGIVEEPQSGTNAMGGMQNFPTVTAYFME
jgi:hypothetical protein